MTTGDATNGDGRAYGRPAGTVDDDLASVNAGTPGGELLRRYWHPVALSEEATDLPRAIRVLGEDLILFRDGSGNPGLVYPRCVHRGTTLLYGKVEDARHPLLLSRLALRRAGDLSRPAVRARARAAPRPLSPAVVPGAGALRHGLRLHGPGREAAAASARTTRWRTSIPAIVSLRTATASGRAGRR